VSVPSQFNAAEAMRSATTRAPSEADSTARPYGRRCTRSTVGVPPTRTTIQHGVASVSTSTIAVSMSPAAVDSSGPSTQTLGKLARELGVPLRHDALQRLRHTEAQTELDAIGRRRNVRGAFALHAGIELPAHVALLDDVMTTGATLAECARVLRRAGVQRVDVWALARAPSPRG